MNAPTTAKTATSTELLAMIVRVVDELGDQGGDAAITMRAVATRVGVSVTSLYDVFAHKQQLLGDAARRAERELDAWLAENCMPCLNSTQRLICMCRAYVEFARRRPWRYRLLFHRGAPATASGDDADLNPFVVRAASTLNHGAWPYRDAEALATAWRLWMALDGLACATLRDDGDARGRPEGLCDPDFVDRFIRMLMRGLWTPGQLERTTEAASAAIGS